MRRAVIVAVGFVLLLFALAVGEIRRSEAGHGAAHQVVQDQVDALKETGREQARLILKQHAQIAALQERLDVEERRVGPWDGLVVAVTDRARVAR